METLPKFPGSGIVYTLTVADAQRVARWLQLNGVSAEAYHAGDDANVDREALEHALLGNEMKALAGDDVPEGNRRLIKLGAQTFPQPFPDPPSSLDDWFTANATSGQEPAPEQYSLF